MTPILWIISAACGSRQEELSLPLSRVVLGRISYFVRFSSLYFTMRLLHDIPWKIIIPLVTFSPVCVPLSWPLFSFPSPFVVFVLVEQLHGSQRRVKILITLHTTRAGHKESVSRLNLMWRRLSDEQETQDIQCSSLMDNFHFAPTNLNNMT